MQCLLSQYNETIPTNLTNLNKDVSENLFNINNYLNWYCFLDFSLPEDGNKYFRKLGKTLKSILLFAASPISSLLSN